MAPKFCLMPKTLVITDSLNFHSTISQTFQVKTAQVLSMSFIKLCPHCVYFFNVLCNRLMAPGKNMLSCIIILTPPIFFL